MVYFSDEYSNDENIILNVDFFFNPTALRSFATSLVHIFVYIFGALLFSFMTFMGHFEINGLSKHTFYIGQGMYQSSSLDAGLDF